MIVINKKPEKTPPKQIISIRLDPAMIEKLDQIAEESKTNRSAVITEILEKVVPKIRVI
ncbi:ribbon-helix-helix protein, CopG family [Tepidibacillus infernus]|uniref:ribbon-helix-helix protein, CopG family n=1 Tax=Tepidibacillus TaxID=1494427 RepID=UPI000856C92F|nr:MULTISPECIES: ribbon-helix-helix protein, CopG family [Tepidibacillus]GBF10514.1 ribbon-helix-helix protein, copG family [Tepidibacillus sp. HK-1]